MAKHRLIISKSIDSCYPVRAEAGQFKETRALIVNWKGSWAPKDRPELCLVVAPGDEIDFERSPDKPEDGSVWLFPRVRDLLVPAHEVEQQEPLVRVDLEAENKSLQINPLLAQEPRETVYDLRISALGERPRPIVGQGQAGNLTATRP